MFIFATKSLRNIPFYRERRVDSVAEARQWKMLPYHPDYKEIRREVSERSCLYFPVGGGGGTVVDLNFSPDLDPEKSFRIRIRNEFEVKLL
jgi:hypothetical protein